MQAFRISELNATVFLPARNAQVETLSGGV
jgi:hypothetical protein